MYTTAVPFSPASTTQHDVFETPVPWYHQSMPDAQQPSEPDAESGNNEVFRVALEDGGKIALPAALRERLGVVEGDYLLLKPQQDGTVVVVSLAHVVERAMGHFSDVAPGRSLAEELIAERREEARKESEG
jgi:bifunctional DNA-binding transcriptional regulator/antitoxin component of YhaV-PrlF toxin-antitoxin module